MAIVLSTLIQDSYFTEHFPLLAESNRDTVSLGLVRCFITRKSKEGIRRLKVLLEFQKKDSPF